MLCAERFFIKMMLPCLACFCHVVLCPGFSLGNFHGGDSLLFPEALPWVKMLCFCADTQFLPHMPCSGAYWLVSSLVYLRGRRLKLTRIGIKVPVGWIWGGCGMDVVMGIPVGYTWEGQGGRCSAGTIWKPIFPIQTPLNNGWLISFVASLSWPYSVWDFFVLQGNRGPDGICGWWYRGFWWAQGGFVQMD